MSFLADARNDGLTNEPQQDKTNKITCAHSEDSDQPGCTGHFVGFFRLWLNYQTQYKRFLVAIYGDSIKPSPVYSYCVISLHPKDRLFET